MSYFGGIVLFLDSMEKESKGLSKFLDSILLLVLLRRDIALNFFCSIFLSSLKLEAFCSALMVPICNPKDLMTSVSIDKYWYTQTDQDFWYHSILWFFWELWTWFQIFPASLFINSYFRWAFWRNYWSQILHHKRSTLLLSGFSAPGWRIVFIANVGELIFTIGIWSGLDSCIDECFTEDISGIHILIASFVILLGGIGWKWFIIFQEMNIRDGDLRGDILLRRAFFGIPTLSIALNSLVREMWRDRLWFIISGRFHDIESHKFIEKMRYDAKIKIVQTT